MVSMDIIYVIKQLASRFAIETGLELIVKHFVGKHMIPVDVISVIRQQV
jgi:hypothetical protein